MQLLIHYKALFTGVMLNADVNLMKYMCNEFIVLLSQLNIIIVIFIDIKYSNVQ